MTRGDRPDSAPAPLNLWEVTAGATVATPALAGEASADALVIGGGFTGLSAALHLAEAGASVILLEARGIGHGGSGRNVGLVNAGLWQPPEAVEARLGAAAGARLNAALAGGPDLVFALIERLGIACAARRAGTLHLAHAPAGARDLARRQAQLAARGAPVTLLDAAETARRTGSPRFHGALFDPRAGTIQPLAYARGLARVAQAAGARLYQNMPALSMRREGTAWVVETPVGRIAARHLLRATDGYATALPAPPATAVHYLQFATAPLPAEWDARILPGGEGCWDTGRVMTSLRRDAAGRLLLGGVGNLAGPGAALHRAWARRMLRRLFPGLPVPPLDFAWAGRIAMSPDHLPRIDRLGPNAVSIHGYSGRGIAPGTLFGKAAADWAATGDEAAFPLPLTDPERPRQARVRAWGYDLGSLAAHALAARL